MYTVVCLKVKANEVARLAKKGFGTHPGHLYKAFNKIFRFTVVNNNTQRDKHVHNVQIYV